MKIKDIVNKESRQISNCDSEPIHIPGSIQPHGSLLAIDESSIIRYCGANTAIFLNLRPDQILNNRLEEIWQEGWSVLQRYQALNDRHIRSYSINYKDIEYDVSFHRSGTLIVLEIEYRGVPEDDAGELAYNQTKQFVALIEQSRTLQELCQRIAAETRKLLAYDRVMIYRFDRNYNGEVFAESKCDDMPPYLGLHYPHTDIPAQARELYLKNLIRVIADVNYDAIPLLTIDDGQERTVDLSDSILRSVSPIHIEYLKNMGVGATLTVSILEGGKLWGLISCHHRVAKSATFSQRQTALFQGHFLSSQIKVQEVGEEHARNIIAEAHFELLRNKLTIEEDFPQKFEQLNSLLALVNATGVLVLHNGEFFEKGLVPPRRETVKLLTWLEENIKTQSFITNQLHLRYPEARSISHYAAGILFYGFGKTKENCIIWFRHEVELTVNWVGDPEEANSNGGPGKALTPRKSFESWKQIVKFTSDIWRVSEINVASRFANTLQNYYHIIHLRNEDFMLRVLNEKLEKANQELANINWITSHDLKEPIRKIRLFTTIIIDKEGQNISDLIRENINRIQKSTNRMQNLVDDILAFSATVHGERKYSETDLNQVFEESKEWVMDEINETGAIIKCDLLATDALVIPPQIRQVFTNLLSNALKYSNKNKTPAINVEYERIAGPVFPELNLNSSKTYHVITMRDNGIGFDMIYSERLFDIFYRLHNKDEYSGTGIGLAICKRIMENHHGTITAKGESGKGAAFSIYLPV
jgi:two-component system, chemotaxis family, sensor kinase Cph1